MSEIPATPPEPAPRQKNLVLVVIFSILGFLALCIVPILAAILFPVFAQARLAAQKTASLSNTKQLALATLMYAAENDDTLPAGEDWSDRITPYLKDPLVWNAPAAGGDASKPRYDYAMLAIVAGRDLNTFQNPSLDVMLFESGQAQRNQTGGYELLPDPPRYGSGDGGIGIVAFIDGHTKAVPYAELRR